MMYNSQVQRIAFIDRLQAVEACAVFRRAVQANAPAYLRPLKGRSLLLPDRLSEARRTGSRESNISFAFEVTEFKCH